MFTVRMINNNPPHLSQHVALVNCADGRQDVGFDWGVVEAGVGRQRGPDGWPLSQDLSGMTPHTEHTLS